VIQNKETDSLLIFMLFGIFNCGKQEKSEVPTSLNVTIKCINDKPLEGVTVDATDNSGTVI